MRISVNKSLHIVVISVLVVAISYSSIFTTFRVHAAPPGLGFGDPNADCWTQATDTPGGYVTTCCWAETDVNDPEKIEIEVCQQCDYDPTTRTHSGCGNTYPAPASTPTTGENIAPGDTGVLEQPPTSSPFDPTAPLQGGVLEQQEQTPPTSAPGTSPGVLQQLEEGDFAPGFAPGFLRQQEEQPPAGQGAAELPPPPATEEIQPLTEEVEQAAPVCQEGLEFSEDLGFCVPEDCPEGQVLDEETGLCVLEEPEAPQEELEEQQQQSEEEQPSEGSGSEEEDTSNN
jgi:hypothetical protein